MGRITASWTAEATRFPSLLKTSPRASPRPSEEDGAALREEQPFISAEWPVEPDGVVQRRDERAGRPSPQLPWCLITERGRAREGQVGGVHERCAVNERIVREPVCRLDPYALGVCLQI